MIAGISVTWDSRATPPSSAVSPVSGQPSGQLRVLDGDEFEDLDGPSRHGQVRVAEADGRVLGFSVVLPRGAGMFQLDGLFVEPGQWGRGIGKALVGAECKRLAAQGGGRLEVVANPRAEGFYEKLGFAVAGGVITMFGPSRRMVLEIKDFSPLPG